MSGSWFDTPSSFLAVTANVLAKAINRDLDTACCTLPYKLGITDIRLDKATGTEHAPDMPLMRDPGYALCLAYACNPALHF